jgi:transcriptional regulator CtsR
VTRSAAKQKLDHDAVVDYVNNNNDSTLQEIADHFETVVSAIHYILRRRHITRKKLVPAQAGKPRCTRSETNKKDKCFWLRLIRSIQRIWSIWMSQELTHRYNEIMHGQSEKHK